MRTQHAINLCICDINHNFVLCLFLFVWSLSFHSRIFHSYGDAFLYYDIDAITGHNLANITEACVNLTFKLCFIQHFYQRIKTVMLKFILNGDIYLCIFFYWTNGDLLQRRDYCLNYFFYNRRSIMSLKITGTLLQ